MWVNNFSSGWIFLPFLIATYSAVSLDKPHFPSGNRSDCCYFKSSFICSLLCILYSHTDRLSDWETGLLSAESPVNLLGRELLFKLSYSVFQMECLWNSLGEKNKLWLFVKQHPFSRTQLERIKLAIKELEKTVFKRGIHSVIVLYFQWERKVNLTKMVDHCIDYGLPR